MTINVALINVKEKACAATDANDGLSKAFVGYAFSLDDMSNIFHTSQNASYPTSQTISADGRNASG